MEGTAAISKTQTRSQEAWRGFIPGHWSSVIDVRDFIARNVTPYSGIAYAMIFPSMTIVKVVAVQIVGLVAGVGAG